MKPDAGPSVPRPSRVTALALLAVALGAFGFAIWRAVRGEMNWTTYGLAGFGVSLRMKSQTWTRIPDLGRVPSVCNSIRVWIKR